MSDVENTQQNIEQDPDAKFEKILKNIQEELTKKQEVWNKQVATLTTKINCELKYTTELSAMAIAQRQLVLEERTHMYYRLYTDLPKLKITKKKYFEFYSTKYAIRTNSGEKAKLIDADVRYYDAKMDYIQSHIDFLTETLKSIDHVIYSVKNKIDLYNASGLD
jgi:hypothetical protein